MRSQRAVPKLPAASAAPWNVIEMQILVPTPDSVNQQLWSQKLVFHLAPTDARSLRSTDLEPRVVCKTGRHRGSGYMAGMGL